MDRMIGIFAGLGTTVSFLPQVVRVVQTRNTEGVSTPMFLIHTSGLSLWIAYGLRRNDLIVVYFNVIACFFCVIILIFVSLFARKDPLNSTNQLEGVQTQ